ncbi:MAG: FadR family transcriptional regulator [Myxococcales bacterium]|nr:FadR family transcriptional regulator [Myxococcales bacterium]
MLEALLAEILRGNFPPGTRLPAEREMARLLGASRPTLREALRRLGEWNLVEPRRGSGIVVRPRSEWTIEVLPAYLRYGRLPDGTSRRSARRPLDLAVDAPHSAARGDRGAGAWRIARRTGPARLAWAAPGRPASGELHPRGLPG